jgi:alpha-ketoglutarate-dependent taurine dioxygenase
VATGGFPPYRITLDEQLVEDLAARPAGELAGRHRDRLRDLADNRRRHVDQGAGVLVMDGFGALRDTELPTALATFSRLIGGLLPQNASGELVREVRDRGTRIGEGRTTRYSDSRLGGNLHTDGAEAPHPVPEYFALLCARQAEQGGALQLVHVRDVCRRLADRPDLLAALREPFHFDRRGDEAPGEPPTTRKAVLFDDDGEPGVTYLRKYIEAGHARDDVPDLTPRQVAALDALDEAIADPGLILEGTMRAGELAIFANRRVLHGRTEFVDHEDPALARLLYRTWIRRAA